MAPTKGTKQAAPATKLSSKAGIKKPASKKSTKKSVSDEVVEEAVQDVVDEAVEAPAIATTPKSFTTLSDEMLLKIFGQLVPIGLVIEPFVTKGLGDIPSAILACNKWREVITAILYGQNSFSFRKISHSMVFLSSIGVLNSRLITNIELGEIWSTYAPLLRQPGKFRRPYSYARAERYPAFLADRCPGLKTLRISQISDPASPSTNWKIVKLKKFQAELDTFTHLKHLSYRPGAWSPATIWSMLLLSKGPVEDTESVSILAHQSSYRTNAARITPDIEQLILMTSSTEWKRST